MLYFINNNALTWYAAGTAAPGAMASSRGKAKSLFILLIRTFVKLSLF